MLDQLTAVTYPSYPLQITTLTVTTEKDDTQLYYRLLLIMNIYMNIYSDISMLTGPGVFMMLGFLLIQLYLKKQVMDLYCKRILWVLMAVTSHFHSRGLYIPFDDLGNETVCLYYSIDKLTKKIFNYKLS